VGHGSNKSTVDRYAVLDAMLMAADFIDTV
jgi:cobalamin biosynthesis Co2+ chelatase CbiK